MPHFLCKLAVLLASIAVISTTLLARSEAAYDCDGSSTRATHGTGQSVTSPTFVNLTGSKLTIPTQGCARINFSAQIRARHPKGLRVRVAVSANAGTPFPPFAEFYTSENRFDGRSVEFSIPDLPFGTHDIRIQVLSTDGTPVGIGRWTMSVHFPGAF
jgi:hypothetical protein